MSRVPSRPVRHFLLLGLSLALLVAFGLRFGLHSNWLAALFGAVNVTTFALYSYDKTAAQNDRRRVPEMRLHLAALSGGSPAAWLAQRWLRHKTIKRPFQLTFWCIVAAQCLALLIWFWYYTRA